MQLFNGIALFICKTNTKERGSKKAQKSGLDYIEVCRALGVELIEIINYKLQL